MSAWRFRLEQVTSRRELIFDRHDVLPDNEILRSVLVSSVNDAKYEDRGRAPRLCDHFMEVARLHAQHGSHVLGMVTQERGWRHPWNTRCKNTRPHVQCNGRRKAAVDGEGSEGPDKEVWNKDGRGKGCLRPGRRQKGAIDAPDAASPFA
jgi:hypothetical protein